MSFIRNFSRIFVGFVFIFSGIVKGVDPLGTAYRIDDYFIAYGTEWAMPLALFLSISLCTLEFVLGISLLFNAWIRKTSWVLFIVMIFFTILTFVDAIWEPVPDCGCFGDAVKLTNWETFYKNILLIFLVAIIFFQRKMFKPPGKSFYAFSVLTVFSILFAYFSLFNLNHLPVLDFREWKVGNNMNPEEGGEAKIYLQFKNIETGEEVEFLSPDYPWQDSVWMSQWEFVDQRIDDSEVIRTHDLLIEDSSGHDVTDLIINNIDYQFILLAYDLENTDINAFAQINALYQDVEDHEYSFVILSSSLPEVAMEFRNSNNLNENIEIFFSDDIVLKTMIRANPGLMLMKDGIVLAKWHSNDIPGFKDIQDRYMKE